METVSKINGKDDNQVALVFSCPGKKEVDKNSLVTGNTGTNLEMLLKKLNELNPNTFKYTNKNDYRITNASDVVHYKAKGNKTEALLSEIRQSKNLDRLYNDVGKYKFIIAFGKKACYAVKQIESKLVNEERVIYIYHHLGTQGLLNIKNDVEGNPIISAKNLKGSEKKKRQIENTCKRLEVVKSKIFQELPVSKE